MWGRGEEDDSAVAVKGPQDWQDLEPWGWWQLGGQAGMTAGLQPPGYPQCPHALSCTVTLHCSLVTWLPLPGKRNREGCTAQPGAAKVPLSPCSSGAPCSQQENLGMRELQQRRGRWLIRTHRTWSCVPISCPEPHRPGEGTGGHICLPHLLLVPALWQMVACPCPFPAAPSPKSTQMTPGDGALLQPRSSQFTQCPVSPCGPQWERLLQNKGCKEG